MTQYNFTRLKTNGRGGSRSTGKPYMRSYLKAKGKHSYHNCGITFPGHLVQTLGWTRGDKLLVDFDQDARVIRVMPSMGQTDILTLANAGGNPKTTHSIKWGVGAGGRPSCNPINIKHEISEWWNDGNVLYFKAPDACQMPNDQRIGLGKSGMAIMEPQFPGQKVGDYKPKWWGNAS